MHRQPQVSPSNEYLNQGLRQKGISRAPLKTHLQKTEIILFMA